MSCAVCRNPDQKQKRKEWGCDGPTGTALSITCPMCDGNTPSCDECGGTARIPFRDCPNRVLTPEHFDVVRTATLMECGVMPTNHGWLDMPQSLMQALQIVARERRRIEDAKRG